MEAASQVNPTQADPGPRSIAREDAASISTLLRRFFPFYCVLAALVTFGYALYDSYQLDGDAVAYMDIGDYLRAHQWWGIVNGYWHPMYPAFLSLGHALLHATLATELRAYYFVNFGIFLLGMLAVVSFADAYPVETRDSEFELSAGPLRAAVPGAGVAGDREPARAFAGQGAAGRAAAGVSVLRAGRAVAASGDGPRALCRVMGLALGCAYLTKSFAFVVAFLSIGVLVAFRWLWLKQKLARNLRCARGLCLLRCYRRAVRRSAVAAAWAARLR